MAMKEAKRYSIVTKLPESNAFEYLTISTPESPISLYELDLYTGNFENSDEIKAALNIPSEYELWLAYKNFGKDWFIPLIYKEDRLMLDIAKERAGHIQKSERVDKTVKLFSLICSRNYFMKKDEWNKEKTLVSSFFTDCNLSPETTSAIMRYFDNQITYEQLNNILIDKVESYRKVRNIYFAIKQMIKKITVNELGKEIVSREMFLLMQELHIDTGIITQELIDNIIEMDIKTYNGIQNIPVVSNLKDNMKTALGFKPDGVRELVYEDGIWKNGDNTIDISSKKEALEVTLLPNGEEPDLLTMSSPQVLLEQPSPVEQYDPHGTDEEKRLEAQYKETKDSLSEILNESGLSQSAQEQGFTFEGWAELSEDQKRSILNGGVDNVIDGPVLSKTLPAFKGAEEQSSEPELIK